MPRFNQDEIEQMSRVANESQFSQWLGGSNLS